MPLPLSLRISIPILLLLSQTTPSLAQDVVAAEALFKSGYNEMKSGDYAAACPKLAESHRLDPRPGTLFTLAECEAKAGRIATAVSHYEDYLRLYASLSVPLRLRHRERAKIAEAQRTALAPSVPELTLILPEDAPSEIGVTRDGVELTATSIGIALPLDPGDHTVTTQVPGGPLVSRTITIVEGEKKTIKLEFKIKKEPPAEPQKLKAKTAPPKPTPTSPAVSPLRVGAYAAAGLGLAGLIAGGVTGGLAVTKKSIVDEHCKGNLCDAEGMQALESGRTLGLISTVGLSAGAAGVTLGAVLFLLSSPKTPQAGTLKPGVHAGVVDIDQTSAVIHVKGAF